MCCGNLSYLDLSYNSIGGSLSSSLFALLPALDTLLLSNNRLQGSAPAVVFSIANRSSSAKVDLSNNQLDGVVGPESCDAMGGASRSSIGAVDLSGNALGCYASCWSSVVNTGKVVMGSNVEPCMPSESPTQAPTTAPTAAPPEPFNNL